MKYINDKMNENSNQSLIEGDSNLIDSECEEENDNWFINIILF